MSDQKVKDHIQSTLSSISVMCYAASKHLQALPVGEKMLATVLAKKVADEFNMTFAQWYSTNRLLVEDFPGITVGHGPQKGGLHKKENVDQSVIDDHIKSVLDRIQVGFDEVELQLSLLTEDDRLSNKNLCREVGSVIGLKDQEFYYTLKMLLNNYPGIKVARGRTGGIKLDVL